MSDFDAMMALLESGGVKPKRIFVEVYDELLRLRALKEKCLEVCASVAADHQATLDDPTKDEATKHNAKHQQYAALQIAAAIRSI